MIAASEAFLGVGFDIMGKHSFTELEVQIVTLLSNFAGNLALRYFSIVLCCLLWCSNLSRIRDKMIIPVITMPTGVKYVQ